MARFLIVSVTLIVWGSSVTATAQWRVSVFVGGTSTHATTIDLRQPELGSHVRFEDVPFDGESWASPIYYGARFTVLPARSSRWSIEAEFLHAKVIADTNAIIRSAGTLRRTGVSGEQRLGDYVQRFAQTHGLNFVLGNLVWRVPVGARAALAFRGGAGLTLPHAESSLDGQALEQYEYGGPAVQGAVGVEVGLVGPLYLLGEYKLTYTSTRVDVVGGTAGASFTTHHLVSGLGLEF